jgi:hypothetical protein
MTFKKYDIRCQKKEQLMLSKCQYRKTGPNVQKCHKKVYKKMDSFTVIQPRPLRYACAVCAVGAKLPKRTPGRPAALKLHNYDKLLKFYNNFFLNYCSCLLYIVVQLDNRRARRLDLGN